MEKRIGKRDIILLIIIFAAVIAIWIGYRVMNRGEGTQVRITVDGEEYGIYNLDEDQEIPIETDGEVTNILIIQDGVADMTWADCPDKLCVNQKAVSSGGETIVCLPNKIVVEVISPDGEAGFDTIAK